MIFRKKKFAIAALSLALAQTIHASPQAAMDRDLLEVSIPQLETFYREHKYIVI